VEAKNIMEGEMFRKNHPKKGDKHEYDEVITVNWTCWQWDEQDNERNIKLDCN